jgi:hypothetical protein
MTRIIKWLLFVFLISAPLNAKAQTINAASCSATDVQTALNAVAADGTTVIIPSCPNGVTWSSTVTYHQVYSTTIQGATTCAPTASGSAATSCTDNTLINWSGSSSALSVTTAANKSFRLTGVSFNLSGITGYYSLFFAGQSKAFRFDHSHIYNVPGGYLALVTDSVTGVIDHIVAQGADNTFFMRPLDSAWNGVGLHGDNSWASATAFGSSGFIFLEDSSVTGQNQSMSGPANHGMATDDCLSGGRIVIRHNILTASSMQDHATGHAGDDRGCRAQETYLNTFPAIPDVKSSGNFVAEFNTAFVGNGAHLLWGNTLAANAYSNFITGHVQRCGPSGGSCGQTYSQSAPPNGWGYCGTTYGPSGWDQNINSSGNACLDQPGRGQGDLLWGCFPNTSGNCSSAENNDNSGKCNITQNPACNVFTGQWPRQNLEPVYAWSNTWSCSGCGGSFWAEYDPSLLQNRDYFLDVGASCPQNGASCATGVGVGTLAQRPANCTTNSESYSGPYTGSGLSSPGVGWWATDTNTLYVCTATNAWTSYYTPYTYPHPLQAGGSASAAVAAPTELTVAVQ